MVNSPLESAIDDAVQQAETERDELRGVVADIRSAIESVRTPGMAESSELRRILTEFALVSAGLIGDAEQGETFNIAFFGRTGAGKSTLLSILGHLDGARVSDGHSDFTTEVTPVAWNKCQLWDTPGINGWGRPDSGEGTEVSSKDSAQERRSILESRARRAVEKADLVLLCFDSQSQQASEFGKIAAWVQEFGKPVIAVLNVRNPRWRHSRRLAAVAARKTLSRAVAEHAGNIRTELDRIGLTGTPIVAYHAQRALFARASEPYSGPAADSLAVERDQFGTDYLLASSNFPTLEQLIVSTIAHGAADLRRASMRDGLRGAADRASADLAAMVGDVEDRIALADVTAMKLIEVLGYPDEENRSDLLGDSAPILADAEEARGGPYLGTASGSIDRYFERLVEKHLAAPRQLVLNEVETLVGANLENGDDTAAEDIRDVYERHREDLTVAVAEMWAAAGAFLNRRVSIVLAQGDQDVALGGEAGARRDGGLKGVFGRVLRVVGIGASAAGGVLVLPAVTNFWNPAGWVSGTAVIGLSAVSAAAGALGDKLSADGQKDGARHRSRALQGVRDAVNESFDTVEADLRRAFREQKWRAAAPHVIEALEHVVNLNRYAQSVPAANIGIAQSRDRIRRSPEPREVIDGAVAEVMASRRRDSARALTSADVWLGEDWIDATDAASVETRAEVLDHLAAVRADERMRLDRFITRAWTPVDQERLDKWLSRIGGVVDDETNGRIESIFAAFDGVPSVVVVGDYSAGKSSLVKRLLAEVGATEPRELRISGAVATDTVQVCDAGHFRIIDCPGFQSGRAHHDSIALAATVSAALVIVVVHVNLMIGDTGLLESIVTGTDLTVGKGRRVLFLVNRADELGADPTIVPEDFARLKELKAAELRGALASLSLDIDDLQVHLVAGDPFGQYADRATVVPSEFDENRSWDGIDPLKSALLGFSRGAACSGATRGIIDEACEILARRGRVVDDRSRQLEHESGVTEDLMRALTAAENEARTLEDSVRERIAKVVRRRADSTIDEIRKIAPGDGSGLRDAVEGWLDESFSRDLERLFEVIATESQHLVEEHSSAIRRELEFTRVEFAGMRPGGAADDFIGAPGGQGSGAAAAGSSAFRLSAGLAKALGNRDAVYAIGKAVGVKFRPWGAVNAGKAVGKFAPILSLVAVGLDSYKLHADSVAADKMREAKVEAEERLRARSAELVESVMRGDDEHPGPGAVLSDFATTVRDLREEIRVTHAESFAEWEALHAERLRISELLSDAADLTLIENVKD
ncbi:GTPase [Tsukamurella sp. USMM236]|uniref:GTPase n=1 Tax=Tsukamurella sp. USMM236 TaxID=3081301 RepID=UPI00301876D5